MMVLIARREIDESMFLFPTAGMYNIQIGLQKLKERTKRPHVVSRRSEQDPEKV